MPDDRYHAIYFAMLLAGVGFLLPYNSFITDVDYLHHKYPGGSPAATSCHRVPPRTLGSGLPPSCTTSTQVGPPQPHPAIACCPAHLALACHVPETPGAGPHSGSPFFANPSSAVNCCVTPRAATHPLWAVSPFGAEGGSSARWGQVQRVGLP